MSSPLFSPPQCLPLGNGKAQTSKDLQSSSRSVPTPYLLTLPILALPSPHTSPALFFFIARPTPDMPTIYIIDDFISSFSLLQLEPKFHESGNFFSHLVHCRICHA